MANLLPITVKDAQDKINTLTSSSIDTPDPTDDQWGIRLNYLQLAASAWARQDVMWRELYVTYTGSATLTSATSYPIDGVSDFRMMSSLLRLHDSAGNVKYIDVIDPEQQTLYHGKGRYAYITGNPAIGFTLNLGWSPVSGDNDYGNTFDFDYYSSGVKPVSPTDKFQMSDPDYAIYWAAAQELLFNGRTDLGQTYQGMATECMDNMRIKNELLPAYADMRLIDVDAIRDNAIIGL